MARHGPAADLEPIPVGDALNELEVRRLSPGARVVLVALVITATWWGAVGYAIGRARPRVADFTCVSITADHDIADLGSPVPGPPFIYVGTTRALGDGWGHHLRWYFGSHRDAVLNAEHIRSLDPKLRVSLKSESECLRENERANATQPGR